MLKKFGQVVLLSAVLLFAGIAFDRSESHNNLAESPALELLQGLAATPLTRSNQVYLQPILRPEQTTPTPSVSGTPPPPTDIVTETPPPPDDYTPQPTRAITETPAPTLDVTETPPPPSLP